MRRVDNESREDDDGRHRMCKKIPTTSTSHRKAKPLFLRNEIGGRGEAKAKLPCDPKMSSEYWSTSDDFKRKLTGGFERKSYTMRSGSMVPSSYPTPFNPCQHCIPKPGPPPVVPLEQP
jgi:hypothetical protein